MLYSRGEENAYNHIFMKIYYSSDLSNFMIIDPFCTYTFLRNILLLSVDFLKAMWTAILCRFFFIVKLLFANKINDKILHFLKYHDWTNQLNGRPAQELACYTFPRWETSSDKIKWFIFIFDICHRDLCGIIVTGFCSKIQF